MSNELDHIMIRAFPTNADAFGLPPEPEQCFDLTELPDPPTDWIFLKKRYERAFDERSLRANTVQILARLHFWGIYWSHKSTPTKRETMKAIWKLYYHCPERNRPRIFKDLFDLERDHGPRLLGWDHHDPKVGPVSRFHPQRPDPNFPASFGFQRSPGIPEDITDVEVERYLLPPHRGRRDDSRIQNLAFPTRDEFLGPDEPTNRLQSPRPAPNTIEASEFEQVGSIARLRPRRVAELVQEAASAAPPAAPPAALPQERAYIPQGQGISPVIPLPQLPDDHQEVIEFLEKTVIKFTYQHLERSRFAPTKVPRATKVADSSIELETVQIGTHPAHSHLRLNPQTLKFSSNSTALFPYRGRGPIWSENSCSVDCVIVLGMLLDIGCTNIDRESWRYMEITDLEKAYIEITNVNWDALTYDQNCAMRDLFRRKLCATVPSIQMGEPAPAWAIWSECTRNMAQFWFRYSTFFKSCSCTNQSFPQPEKYANCVCPVIIAKDADGVWLTELIERVLYNKTLTRCLECGNQTDVTETRIEELPSRMVVSNFMGYSVRVHNHTDDVRFRYVDVNGIDKIATYRWLGGIYHKDGHVRVYFTDQERGDTSSKDIRMYDDEMNSGAIFGGISPGHASDRVPYDWTTTGFLLAVYERVINPPEDMLLKAAEAIGNMAACVSKGAAVLDHHTTWKNPQESIMEDPARALVEGVEERRIIPVSAEHIREVHLQELPRSITQQDDAFQMNDLGHLLNDWPPQEDIDMIDVIPPVYDNLFDSMLNSPSHVSGFPELWPEGSPRQNGSLNFPSLPRSDGRRPNHPVVRRQTPAMDYNWTSPLRTATIDPRLLWGNASGAQGGVRGLLGRSSQDERQSASQRQSRASAQRVEPTTSRVQKTQPPSKKRPLEKQTKPSSSKEPTKPKEPPGKKIKTEKRAPEVSIKKEVKKEKTASNIRDIPAKKSVKGKEPIRNSASNSVKKSGKSSSNNPLKA